MRARTRLERLKRQAAKHHQAEPERESFWEQIDRQAAYLCGQGPRPPDPPCPSWFDPAEWASRMRIGRCLDYRWTGELGPGEYLPDMTEEERRYVDSHTPLIVGGVTSLAELRAKARGEAEKAGSAAPECQAIHPRADH
jgi:hypothetical protein